MIKLKSNQLSYKLFLALCILGSGIHVHGVESSTGTINAFVPPNSVREAGDMLVSAVQSNNLARVQYLTSDDRTVKPKNGAVVEAVMTAVRRESLEVLDHLLNLRGELESTPPLKNYRSYALDAAAMFGQENVAQYLLSLGGDLEVTPDDVGGALNRAARMGHEGVVQYLTSDECLVKPAQDDVESSLLAAAENGRTKTLKYLLSQGRVNIGQQVLQRAFNKLVSKMDLKDLAEIPFPKEVYKNSKELSARLAQNPLSGEELKAIMAIGAQDGRTSAFAEHLMSEQHYQDAMALMKLRQQDTTKVSKLPSGVSRRVLEYTHPNIAVKSNEQDQAKKGGQQNDVDSID